MKTDNKWLYVGGVGVLAVLVVVGLVYSGDDGSSAGADGGSATEEDGDGGAANSDATPDEAEADAGDGEAAEENQEVAEAEGDEPDAAAVVEPVPEDPAECRAYCQRLAERGALAEGMEESDCVEQLCGGTGEESGDGGAGQERVSTISEPDVPELPDECRAQCEALHERGDLRDGMSLEDCYSQLCSADEEEEEEEPAE